MIGRRRAPGLVDLARRARYEAAFRQVFEPLQRYARRRTDAATADEVVAETLTILWRRLDDVPSGAELPWCYGVARRALANERRGDRRRAGLMDRLVHEATPMVGASAGSSALPGEGAGGGPGEGDTALDGALATLSADDREIVRLWAWEGLAPREIATVLGLSANAVSIRLHRTKRSLAEKLGVAGKTAASAGHMSGDGTDTHGRSNQP